MLRIVESAKPLLQITELAKFLISVETKQQKQPPSSTTPAATTTLPTPEEWTKLPPKDGVAKFVSEGIKLLLSTESSVSEDESEGFFNIVASLATKSGDIKIIPSMASQIASDPKSRSLLRLRILMNVFNGLDIKSPRRAEVFKAIVTVGNKSGNTNLIIPLLPRVEVWLAEWNATPQQRREVLELCCSIARETSGGNLLLHTLLPKLLSTYEGTEQKELLSQASTTAINAVSLAVGLPDVFRMDDLLNLSAVRHLKESETADKTIALFAFELLTIFVFGNLNDYRNLLQKSSSEVLASLNLKNDDCERKIRLLTLVSLCDGKQEVNFSEVAKELDISEESVEQWFVEAVSKELLSVRIDQQNKKVFISGCFQRVFGKQQWIQLQTRLEAWKTSIVSLKGVLQQVASAKPQDQFVGQTNSNRGGHRKPRPYRQQQSQQPTTK